MNFKDWKIKVVINAEYDSKKDESQDLAKMKHVLNHLVFDCDFMPRRDDLIHDLTGLGEPLIVDIVAFNVEDKTIEFILSETEEEED